MPEALSRGLALAEEEGLADEKSEFAIVKISQLAIAAIWFPERDCVIAIAPPAIAPPLSLLEIYSSAEFVALARQAVNTFRNRPKA